MLRAALPYAKEIAIAVFIEIPAIATFLLGVALMAAGFGR